MFCKTGTKLSYSYTLVVQENLSLFIDLGLVIYVFDMYFFGAGISKVQDHYQFTGSVFIVLMTVDSLQPLTVAMPWMWAYSAVTLVS